MTQIEVDGEWLEQCDNCGNIWDGYAQCNCWQWDHNWAENFVMIALEEDRGDDSGYDTE